MVLGSTQSDDLVSPVRLQAWPVELVRRRGGGGAVYLAPAVTSGSTPGSPGTTFSGPSTSRSRPSGWGNGGSTPWPRLVGLVSGRRACRGRSGCRRCAVQTGRSVPGAYGASICFSGRGPGEVFPAGSQNHRTLPMAQPGGCALLDLAPTPNGMRRRWSTCWTSTGPGRSLATGAAGSASGLRIFSALVRRRAPWLTVRLGHPP